MKVIAAAALFAVLLTVSPAGAVTVRIPYTGQLADGGAPVEGTHAVTIQMYDAESAGNLLFTYSGALPFDHGVFSVDLELDSAIIVSHDSLWVGVALDGAPELVPRVRIGVVPYAVRALSPQPSPPPGTAFAWDFPTIPVPDRAGEWTAVAEVTLNAPAAGQVWVTCSGWWQENSNTVPNYVGVEFILGEGTPPPISQMQQYHGFFQFRSWPFSHTTVLPASAGPHTYTMWVSVSSPSQPLTAFPLVTPATMQAMWVPADYGN